MAPVLAYSSKGLCTQGNHTLWEDPTQINEGQVWTGRIRLVVGSTEISDTCISAYLTHEAQSAPPPLPTDFDQRIREILDAALASLTLILKAEFDMIRADIKLGIMDVIVAQTEVLSRLAKMKEDIDDQGINLDSTLSVTLSAASDARDKAQQLLQHFGVGGSSSSTFGLTTGPSSSSPVPEVQPSIPVAQHYSPPSSPTFSFSSPPLTTSSPASSSTPSTVVLPSPITPSTEILPDPLPCPSVTAGASVLLPPTPLVIILPPSTSAPDVPSDPSAVPPLDDKGEKERKMFKDLGFRSVDV